MNLNFPKSRWVVVRVVGITLAGALAGFLYYHFVGCASGTCPLTSNPFLTTGFGAALGLTIGWPDAPRTRPGP